MMTLYGMTAEECDILEAWALKFPTLTNVAPERYLVEWRRAWMKAGGRLPVNDADALFLKPQQVAA